MTEAQPNDPPAIRKLVKRLENERFSTRLNAALELAELEDERAIPVLLEATQSDDEDIADAAHEGLALIAGPTGLIIEEDDGVMLVAGEESIPYWRDMLYVDNADVQESAFTILEVIGTDEAIKAIKEWQDAFDEGDE